MQKNSTCKPEQPLVGRGALFSYDERDKDNLMYGDAPQVEKAVRQSWKLGPVMDQRNTSHCVGYAWAHFLQSEPWNTDPATKKINPVELYRKAQEIDEWPGSEPDAYGTSVRAAAKVLVEEGFISRYLWAFRAEDIAKFVYERGPVVASTRWYTGMTEPDPNGFARPISDYEGGHAWLIYGVDTQWEIFFGVNSWGSLYGRNGRFYIKFSDMQKLLDTGGQACSAIKA